MSRVTSLQRSIVLVWALSACISQPTASQNLSRPFEHEVILETEARTDIVQTLSLVRSGEQQQPSNSVRKQYIRRFWRHNTGQRNHSGSAAATALSPEDLDWEVHRDRSLYTEQELHTKPRSTELYRYAL